MAADVMMNRTRYEALKAMADDAIAHDEKLVRGLKERVAELEEELADYKTVMSCGHCRAATVVEDPPYCAICRIVKERDDWKNAFYKALGSISDASKRQRVYESLRWH